MLRWREGGGKWGQLKRTNTYYQIRGKLLNIEDWEGEMLRWREGGGKWGQLKRTNSYYQIRGKFLNIEA